MRLGVFVGEMVRGIGIRGAIAVCLALAVCLLARLATAPAALAHNQKRPNLVLVVTDDQPLATFSPQWMPNTFHRIVDRGTNFTDAVDNSPLCSPSRATLLTGQYNHNNDVLTNTTGYRALHQRHNVLPVWLQRAGYRTGHFGKFLHHYGDVKGLRPAPGWDRWVTLGDRHHYYDYNLSVDGERVHEGHKARDHVTAVTTRAADHFVRTNVRSRHPLYVQMEYFAPHESGKNKDPRCSGAPEPERRDKRAAKGEKVPQGPAFNEADVSDKPAYSRLGLMSKGDIRTLNRRYRCIAASMVGVDRGIKSVMKRFHDAHELRNTAFVFMTDNGIFLGEHRVRDGKSRGWEEGIRTPLAMRFPRSVGRTRKVVRAQAAAIDVAPTLLDLAGAKPCNRHRCRVMDGRSLLDAAEGDSSGIADRHVLIEMAEEPTQEKRAWACSFTALRDSSSIFINGTRIPDPETKICEDGNSYEYYDLADDPYELQNTIPGDKLSFGPKELADYELMRSLESCSGIEGRDPPSPGGYCE